MFEREAITGHLVADFKDQLHNISGLAVRLTAVNWEQCGNPPGNRQQVSALVCLACKTRAAGLRCVFISQRATLSAALSILG
jgi:hypothetical protein